VSANCDPYRVVELPDAAEARCVRDLAEAEVCRLDERAGVAYALVERDRERARAQLGGEDAVELPRTEADALCEAWYATAIHDPVRDERHRTSDDVAAYVPLAAIRASYPGGTGGTRGSRGAPPPERRGRTRRSRVSE